MAITDVSRSFPNQLRFVVVDNGDASFEVGDQVPVTTGSSATVLQLENNAAIVNTVDYVNTGVILHVTPARELQRVGSAQH